MYIVKHQECSSAEHSHLFGWHGVVVLSCVLTPKLTLDLRYLLLTTLQCSIMRTLSLSYDAAINIGNKDSIHYDAVRPSESPSAKVEGQT
jgi:hypothetical protein